MTRRILAALASAALLASPIAAQNITIGNTGPDMADVLKKPVPKTQKQWWPLWHEMIAKLRGPIVGDAEEPELGKNLDKVPDYIPSNFDPAQYLVPSWGSGTLADPSHEPEGAFRFLCSAGQVIRDDPIVFPGQPGKSHLHQFFGNTGANAFSTYRSLRTTGDSTCMNPLNRSAYWMPAMLDGRGNVVRPDYVTNYYKQLPDKDPDCGAAPNARAKGCRGIPRGIRFIFGFDMMGGKQPTGAVTWGCDGPTAFPGNFRSLADVAKVCKAGNRIFGNIGSPDCWNGKYLDSPDHRTHVSYGSYGSWGYLKCDEDHPYLIPRFSMSVAWFVEEGDDPTLWSLSSDDMTAMGHGMMPPGSTWHVDFMPAWDEPNAEQRWMAGCIQAKRSCNGGDLGDRTQLKDVTGFDWIAHPRKIPIPAA